MKNHTSRTPHVHKLWHGEFVIIPVFRARSSEAARCAISPLMWPWGVRAVRRTCGRAKPPLELARV